MNSFFRFHLHHLSAIIATACICIGGGVAVPLFAATPSWKLAWEDDFDTLDEERWELVETAKTTNDSQQAYLPDQLSVADGKLVITAENKPAEGLPYRSGQVRSKSEQRFGRWEIRAKLPTSQGMWPAIWLLPDEDKYDWPTGGEIDIMENRGNQPLITSSAFHYGTKSPYKHEFVAQEQRSAIPSGEVNYHEDFHTYAVDWTANQLRFYVDGVHHFTVQDDQVDGFLSKQTAPMQLVINNAIGGTFLPNPDETTVWPQTMEIDWVRVYTQGESPEKKTFVNGGFDQEGGSLAGWSVFGNRVTDLANVLPSSKFREQGKAGLKLFGQFSHSENFSGITQGICVAGGQVVEASLKALLESTDGLAGTKNYAVLKIEFYDRFGAEYGTPSMLGVKELTIANASTPVFEWHTRTIRAKAPQGAVEARVALVFVQPANEGGAVYIDSVKFKTVD